MNDDTISRQAAIEIIQSMYPGMPRVPWMRKDWQERYEPYIRTENAIRELPSAQPEIILCKDCKYWEQECICEGYCSEIEKGGFDEDHFCSYAERREE